MSQNFFSLDFNEADIKAIDDALDVLEQKFTPLLELSPDQRLALAGMIEKSSELYQQALVAVSLNPEIIPESFVFPEDQQDLDSIDKLRSRIHRIRQLLDNIDDGQWRWVSE